MKQKLNIGFVVTSSGETKQGIWRLAGSESEGSFRNTCISHGLQPGNGRAGDKGIQGTGS